MKIALIDMDGVVADERHRNWIVKHIKDLPEKDKQDAWDMYHEQMEFDEPFNGIIIDVNSLPKDVLVVILTGRPVKYKKETEEQLKRWGVRHDHLIMRKYGDKQSALTLKKRIVLYMLEIGLDIVKAMDDRSDICEMYREFNIPTIEVKYYG